MISDKQREEMEALRKTQREFQELLKFQGWAQLAEYAEKQISHREVGLQGQSQGLDQCISNEFVKGEIAGIRLFLNIPAVVIEDFDSQLEEIKEEVNDGTSSNESSS